MSRKVEVVKPQIEVRHDKYSFDSLFLLTTENEWMKRPDENTKLYGPALVLVVEKGLEKKVYVYHSLRDVRPWKWLDTLAKAGSWALSSNLTGDWLPDAVVKSSPRFSDTDKRYRKRKSEAARSRHRSRKK